MYLLAVLFDVSVRVCLCQKIQIISSCVDVRNKSGTTPCVFAGCIFLTLVFVSNVFCQTYHKVTVPMRIVQSMYTIDRFCATRKQPFFDVRGANTINETFFFSILFHSVPAVDFLPSLLSLSPPRAPWA